jgi:DNA processing protein
MHEKFVLSLLRLPGIGRKSAWKIARASQHTIPTTSDALFDAVSSAGAPRQGITRDDAAAAWDYAGRVLDTARQMQIVPLAATRPEFPRWLQSIPDPPLVLFIKGDVECIKTPLSLAVIGTREPTEYGKKVAHRFGQRGAESGCVIISGLAVGCDSEGHRGCLDAGGKTVAVLAHGLDRVYPKESRQLADEILAKGGCWVSEYPPGTRAQRGYFVERDRLQSGMSSGVIVVETDTDGGTMHTVRFAETQGKPLACLAPPKERASTNKTRGNCLLIQEKRATPLKTAEDLSTFIQKVATQANQWQVPAVNVHFHRIEAAPPPPTARHLFPEESNDGGNPF